MARRRGRPYDIDLETIFRGFEISWKGLGPMKRGPSKGYIKELSDRVATLEQEDLDSKSILHRSELMSIEGSGLPMKRGPSKAIG